MTSTKRCVPPGVEMAEPVYHARTGEIVAYAYWPEELPPPPVPKARSRTKVPVFKGGPALGYPRPDET